jgi:hypothetical protein
MVEAEGRPNDLPGWLSHEEALEALSETSTKIIRTIGQ